MKAMLIATVRSARAALLACGLATPPVAASAADLAGVPIFDAHVHYSADAWTAYPVDQVRSLFDTAGVRWALVSSSPDDGTLALRDADPERVIPELRPYHGSADPRSWLQHPDVLSYLKQRLARNTYAGIGEFHVFSVRRGDPEFLQAVARLAVERGIILHVHSGAGPVRLLFDLEPELTILWAHAGLSEPVEVVDEMLGAHERLFADTSFRESQIAPGGALSAAWREFILRHADRFLVGSDTYVNAQWARYGAVIEANRRWLAQLPEAAALDIAYRNALRLFGLPE